MNTQKEKWESPRIEVHRFTPQEFITACYVVKCNVESFNYMYMENGKQPGLQISGENADDLKFDTGGMSYHGCDKFHKGVNKNPSINGYACKIRSSWPGGPPMLIIYRISSYGSKL